MSSLFPPHFKNFDDEEYRLSDGTAVSWRMLERFSGESQKEVMQEWFFENYSDPNILPYEDDFVWIWGGPFDAGEVLNSEFHGVVRDSALQELIKELSEISFNWSGHPDSLDETIGLTPYDTLEISLNEIEAATQLKTLGASEQFIRRLLFANVVTVLETYLADRFIVTIKDNPELIKKFIETDGTLKVRKVSLSDVSGIAGTLDKLVIAHVNKKSWHDLTAVGRMYQDTLGITFPNEAKLLKKSISARHDIVHRNGKSPDGEIGSWCQLDISNLLAKVRGLAKDIEGKF